jgi:hypothetical protein
MATVSRTLRRIKQDLQPFLSDQDILDACDRAGHRWRRRLLDPVVTVHLFVLQILQFNTALTHLRHLAKYPVKAAAFCRARQRLPLSVLQGLLARTAAAARSADRPPDWNGLRAFLVDGSSTICPDTPALQKAFGQPQPQKPGCGFPVPKLLGLFDAFSGMILELLVAPLYTHDLTDTWRLHKRLQAGDLLIGDRGLCSFGHLALLAGQGLHGLFRLHQRTIVDFRPHRKSGGKGRPTSKFVKRLGKRDQLVDWQRPKVKARWMSPAQHEALPESLRVREVRYQLQAKGRRTRKVTVVTTLLDPVLYPYDLIAKLYGVRWTVETHLGELKTTLKMRQVKCKTPEGVKKELAVYCLVYNLVRAVMLEAAARQQVDPQRISFLDTIRWLTSAAPGEDLPDLLVNLHRPDRHEPRVIKDLKDTYRKMTKPRHKLKRELHLWRGRPK